MDDKDPLNILSPKWVAGASTKDPSALLDKALADRTCWPFRLTLPSTPGKDWPERLKGLHVLEVVECINVSASGDDKFQDGPRRVLKVLLRQGLEQQPAALTAVGIEYAPIPISMAALQPGTRVLVRDVRVSLGALLLTADNFRLLSGPSLAAGSRAGAASEPSALASQSQLMPASVSGGAAVATSAARPNAVGAAGMPVSQVRAAGAAAGAGAATGQSAPWPQGATRSEPVLPRRKAAAAATSSVPQAPSNHMRQQPVSLHDAAASAASSGLRMPAPAHSSSSSAAVSAPLAGKKRPLIASSTADHSTFSSSAGAGIDGGTDHSTGGYGIGIGGEEHIDLTGEDAPEHASSAPLQQQQQQQRFVPSASSKASNGDAGFRAAAAAGTGNAEVAVDYHYDESAAATLAVGGEWVEMQEDEGGDGLDGRRDQRAMPTAALYSVSGLKAAIASSSLTSSIASSAQQLKLRVTGCCIPQVGRLVIRRPGADAADASFSSFAPRSSASSGLASAGCNSRAAGGSDSTDKGENGGLGAGVEGYVCNFDVLIVDRDKAAPYYAALEAEDDEAGAGAAGAGSGDGGAGAGGATAGTNPYLPGPGEDSPDGVWVTLSTTALQSLLRLPVWQMVMVKMKAGETLHVPAALFSGHDAAIGVRAVTVTKQIIKEAKQAIRDVELLLTSADACWDMEVLARTGTSSEVNSAAMAGGDLIGCDPVHRAASGVRLMATAITDAAAATTRR